MRRFFCPEIKSSDKTAILDREQSDHARNVLRLRNGENVRCFDGKGAEFLCSIEDIGKKRTPVSVSVIKSVPPAAPESELQLTLAAAILKGEKFDLVIQKSVELGVAHFQPVITARCEGSASFVSKKLERYQKIIVEASKQCGRATLMQITEPLEFPQVLADSENSLLFYEGGGKKLPNGLMKKKITAFIGPEGGWESSEIEMAERNSAQIINLGGRILRAETAAISIATILQHRFGDLN